MRAFAVAMARTVGVGVVRSTHVSAPEYLVAMLFILFDVEAILLYPVALHLKATGVFVLLETAVFVALLLVAYVFVWRRGALEWR